MAAKVPNARVAAAGERRVRRIVKKQVREFEEATTWDHPTFRIDEQIFATLHENGLILRCSKSEAQAYLRDERFAPARYWGRFGWVCVDIETVDDNELGQLLSDAAGRIRKKRRR